MKSPIKHTSGQKSGMSFLEVLIGFTLLALIFLPCMKLMTAGLSLVSATQEHLQAVQLAERIVELSQACEFSRLAMFQARSEVEQKLTFEWDITRDNQGGLDRLPCSEEIRATTYRVTDVRFEPLQFGETDNGSTAPVMILMRFKIEYRTRNGHLKEFHAYSARTCRV